MYKYVMECAFVFLFFFVVEGCFYIKDYNELIIVNEYVKYEVKTKKITSLKTDKYNVVVKENGSYSIAFKRNSIFAFGKNKTINYNGIV